MQQQQQQPGMSPFSPAGGGTTPVVTQHAQPSPISSRPPEGQQRVDGEPAGAGGSSAPAGSCFDHEGLSGGGDEGERGGSAGNRWPRQETLALLKIRSEMDAAFREAALKGPLWEEVSRKLAAMGYKRSAKKCREKFENVDKYYKRTKDGRAGRGDGKAYRFFSELEALHGAGGSPHPPPATSLAPTPVAMAPPPAPFPQLGVHTVLHAEPPVVSTMAPTVAAATTPCMVTPADLSFSSSSDGEDTDETGDDGGKRKRRGGDGGGGGSSKMMRFFEGLMRQVMERQEEMQQRFIEAIERREQDRMIREEAWRRQEVARLAREQDALAQERAMAASRDAAVVSFIQRITGQTIPMPPPPSSVAAAAPPPASMFSTLTTQQQQPLKPMPVASAAPAPPPATLAPKPQTAMPTTMTTQSQLPQPHSTESKDAIVRVPSEMETMMGSGGAPSPSRWPKAEVHALIQLRTELEARYQDSGPKGPLWEDISAGMRRLGYNRSAKRCKEKWENINKYFKKVKESNKKRPEDSKTCPYYHQLEALYRSKALAASSPHPPPPPRPADTVLAAVPLSQTAPAPPPQDVHKNNGNGCASPGNGGSSGGMQTHTHQGTNGGVAAARFPVEGGNGTPAKKQQEDIIIKERAPMAEETTPQPVSMNDSYVNDRMDAGDSDSMDDDDDEDDFDDDDVGGGNSNSNKMQYEIQFQRQQQQSQSSVVRTNATAGAGSGPGPATTTGSFLTMVHH